MRICICGGGSLGHVCSGVIASHKDVELNILSGHPESWQQTITVTDINSKQFVANINRISSNPEEVAKDQDIILLCLPGYMIESTLRKIKPFVGNAAVGSVVSSTGFFFYAHDTLGDKVRLFGFQRVPFIARVVEYGKTANLLGYKANLSVVLENIEDREVFRANLERLLVTPVNLLDSFYEVSLSNANPILHTGRLYTMFYGREKEVFDHNILFYKEWTNEASQLIIDMDKEFFQLLDKLNVNSLPTLLDYYESTDAASLTRKIESIPAFQTILSPMKQVEGGWVADFENRYFSEDFPFGLKRIYDLAIEKGISCPNIEKVYLWGASNIEK